MIRIGGIWRMASLIMGLSGCGPRDLMVDFKPGIQRPRVDEINATVGSYVIKAPELKASNLYLIGLAVTVSWDCAHNYYERHPDVAGVLSADSYPLF